MRRCLPACNDLSLGRGRPKQAGKLVCRKVYMGADLCGGSGAVEEIEGNLQQVMSIAQHALPVGPALFHIAPAQCQTRRYRANR